MQDPEKLRVSVLAEELAVRMYRFTADFPREERFTLVAQMRRAAISVGSNIYEGAGRQSNRGFAASLYNSYSETVELLFQLRVSRRLGFGKPSIADEIRRLIKDLQNKLRNLIRRVEGSE